MLSQILGAVFLLLLPKDLYLQLIYLRYKVNAEVRDLELAQGIKDSLKEAGFDTVDSILKWAPSDISNKLGIDPYVAQIIKDAAKRAIDGSSDKEAA